MGIDRIGKGGPPVAPHPTAVPESAPARSGEAAKTFEVRPPSAAVSAPNVPASTAPQPVAGSPLERVLAGEIDVDHYLDLKVTEATGHLKGLGAAEMSALRSLLREQLTTDPALVDLVQQVAVNRAGSVPKE